MLPRDSTRSPPRIPVVPAIIAVVIVVVVIAAVLLLLFIGDTIPPRDVVLFRETGLPSGRAWWVIVNQVTHTSSNDTIEIELLPGDYGFSASLANGTDYIAYPASGHFVLAASNTTVPISFVRSAANLTLHESGLPSGVTWTAKERFTYYHSNTTAVTVTEPNGNHTIRVLAAVSTQVYNAGPARIIQDIYAPNVSELEVAVNGSDLAIEVHFALAVDLNWSRSAISVFPNDTAIPSPAYAYIAFTFYRYTTANVSFYGTTFKGVPQGLLGFLMTPSEFNAFQLTGNATSYVLATGNVSQSAVSLNFANGTWYFALTGWSLDEFRAYTLQWLISFPGAVVYFS